MISIDDFKKVDIVVGKILSVEKIPETDKLLKLSVDFGPASEKGSGPLRPSESVVSVVSEVRERDIRQIVSGIAPYFSDCAVLIGKKCMFVANLEPRVIRGFESQGMILAVSTDSRSTDGSSEVRDGKFSLLYPNDEIPIGARVK